VVVCGEGRMSGLCRACPYEAWRSLNQRSHSAFRRALNIHSFSSHPPPQAPPFAYPACLEAEEDLVDEEAVEGASEAERRSLQWGSPSPICRICRERRRRCILCVSIRQSFWDV
jgi:hypothetical protein